MRVNRTFPVIVLLIATGIALCLAPQASAANVYTADANGTRTDTFLMGDKIRIIAYGVSPYSIDLTDPDGFVRYTDTSRAVRFDKVLTGYTDKPGKWIVRITERFNGPQPLGQSMIEPSSFITTDTEYMTVVQNAIPEAPLGTLAISIALCMALALGIFYKRP